MWTSLLLLSSFDPTFSFICALFAPPTLLSLLLVLQALHRHNFRLWSLKLHLYHTTTRLHLPIPQLPATCEPTLLSSSLVLPFTAPPADEGALEEGEAANKRVKLKDATVLLPPHRQAEVQQQKEREKEKAKEAAVAAYKRSAPPTGPSPSPDSDEGGAESEATALQRVSLSPILSLAFILALSSPVLFLLSWCALLLVNGYVVTALALLFSFTGLVPLVVGLASWQRRGWQWTSHVSGLLSTSLLSYGALMLTLTFLLSSDEASLSFFSLSIQFLALHFVLVMETEVLHHRTREAELRPYLQGRPRERSAEEEKLRNLRLTQHQLRLQKAREILGKDAVDETIETHQLTSQPQVVPRKPDSDDEEDEDEEDGGLGGSKVKLVELPSHTHSFTSHIRAQVLRARMRHMSKAAGGVARLQLASVATLVAYSVVMAFRFTSSVSQSSFDGRYMGVLVSLTVMAFDVLLSLLAGDVQPWVVLALGLMTRLVLAAFDENGWYIGYSILFAVYAVLLVHLIVASYLPWWGVRVSGKPREMSVEAKPMTIAMLLSSPPPRPESFPSYARPLASAMDTSSHPSTLWKLLLVTLLTLFLMATAVAYQTTPPPYSAMPQYQLGFLVLVVVVIASLIIAEVRLLFFFSFHLNWQTVGCGLAMEAVFVGCGFFVWATTSSWLVLLLASLLPPFGLSLLAVWTLAICEVSDRWSRRSLLSVFVCIVLLTGVGLSVSELSEPSFLGWTLVLCALIALTGAMPLVKFYSTLSLDGMDELAIVASLALLAGLVGLLCNQLSLDLLPSLLLIAGGCGFPVLLTVIGACIEYHYHHRASSLCVFAVGLLYVYLLALSALTLAVVDFAIGAVVCIASAFVILISALFMYWRHRGYRLPFLLRLVLALVVVAILVAGAMLSVYLALWYHGGEDVEAVFFAFSGTWFAFIACLALYALMSHYAATAGPVLLHFSPALFPVFVYNKRTGDLSLLHRPLMLTLLCVLLFLAWSLTALLLSYLSLGLASATLVLLLTYVGIRHLTQSSTATLLPLVHHVDEAAVLQVHADVWKAHSVGWEGEPTRAAVVRALEDGLDVKRLWRQKQRKQREAIGLYSSHLLPSLYHLLLSAPSVDALDLDFLSQRLLETEATLSSLSALLHVMAAHTFFLLQMTAATRLHEERGVYGLFRVWLQKVKGVRLDERLQVEEVWTWGSARRREMAVWIDEWQRGKKKQREGVEENRLIESTTQQRRAELLAFQQRLTSGGEPSTPPADDSPPMATEDQYGGLQAAFTRGSAAPRILPRKRKTAIDVSKEKMRLHHAIAQGRLKVAASKAVKSTVAVHASQRPASRRRESSKKEDADEADAAPGTEVAIEKRKVKPSEIADQSVAERPSEEEAGEANEACADTKAVEAPRSSQQNPAADEQIDHPSRSAAPSTSSASVVSSSSASADHLVVPLVLHDHEEAHALFSRIQAAYESTGVKWVDVTFPAASSSIYIDGVRDPTRPLRRPPGGCGRVEAAGRHPPRNEGEWGGGCGG